MAMVASAFLLLFLAVPTALAVQHIVGGNSGWTSGGDYKTWAAGETFTVGDTLLFNYDSSHKVDVVNENDYTNCITGNALESHSDGKTTITLSKTGPTYFICPSFGHCSSGMKLAVSAVPSGTPATPTTPATSPPSTSGSPPSGSGSTDSPPPPPTPSGGTSGRIANLGVRVLIVAAAVVGAMSW